MQYEWDEKKRRRNVEKHGVDFTDISEFQWKDALEAVDDRFDYGEERINAVGFIGTRIVIVTYVERGEVIRVISLRKATKTEEKFYHEYS
ncbi:MAG: BrnT family toxin [Candidatus Electrothrix sp. Rat3]|nr:BrnT family toxin [Candidatus Electrothrix rattekaaiensis]